MIVEFDKSFLKSIDKIKDHDLNLKIERIIIDYEKAESITEIKNTKKLIGFKSYYRTRIRDYRIGFEKINSNTIRLITIAHRKEIYKVFP